MKEKKYSLSLKIALVSVSLSFLVSLGAEAAVITGTITDWMESGPIQQIGDGSHHVSLSWSIMNIGRGWFYQTDCNIAFASGVTDISQITNAAIFNFSNYYVGPCCDALRDADGVGDFIVWRNPDGYYGVLRIDDIHKIDPGNPNLTFNTALNGTWWFQTDGTGNFVSEPTTFTVSGTVTYDANGADGYPMDSVTIELHQGSTVETHVVSLTGTGSPKTYSFTTNLTGSCDVIIPQNDQAGWFGDSTNTNVTLSPTTTVSFSLTHAMPGDADMDGMVYDSDIDILNGCYGIVDGTAVWCVGDFDGDGNVYDSDVDILNGCYGLGVE